VTAALEFGETDLRLSSMLEVEIPALFDPLLAGPSPLAPSAASGRRGTFADKRKPLVHKQ
jgi:hypothetical protein